MARLVVVAVMDRALPAYGRPLFVPSIGVAMRSFADEVNRASADNQMNQHPEDFELWHLGEFDEASGAFVQMDATDGGASMVRMLVRGVDVVRKEN